MTDYFLKYLNKNKMNNKSNNRKDFFRIANILAYSQIEIYEKGSRLSYDILYLYEDSDNEHKAEALEIAYDLLHHFNINVDIEMSHQTSIENWFEMMHPKKVHDMIIFVTHGYSVQELVDETKRKLNIPVFNLITNHEGTEIKIDNKI
jgi:hypothetical protein